MISLALDWIGQTMWKHFLLPTKPAKDVKSQELRGQVSVCPQKRRPLPGCRRQNSGACFGAPGRFGDTEAQTPIRPAILGHCVSSVKGPQKQLAVLLAFLQTTKKRVASTKTDTEKHTRSELELGTLRSGIYARQPYGPKLCMSAVVSN